MQNGRRPWLRWTALGLLAIALLWMVGTRVKSSLAIARVATEVGATYGDPHPKVLRVISTVTDNPPNGAMFLVRIGGTFKWRGHRSREMGFSMTANGGQVWAVCEMNVDQGCAWFPTPP